jgi:hypothetical protein
MYIVGSDGLMVMGDAAQPEGTRHAVDPAGRVLCRDSRPRFSWPALDWATARGDDTCGLCAQVHTAKEALSQVPAYPTTPMPSTTPVPWQPAPGGLFEVAES